MKATQKTTLFTLAAEYKTRKKEFAHRPLVGRFGTEAGMAYDASKDQVLETWKNDDTGLTISICRYGEGDPKLQIGPRVFIKRDGSERAAKAGRLSIDDVLWLRDILEEAEDSMKNLMLDAEAS